MQLKSRDACAIPRVKMADIGGRFFRFVEHKTCACNCISEYVKLQRYPFVRCTSHSCVVAIVSLCHVHLYQFSNPKKKTRASTARNHLTNPKTRSSLYYS